MSRRGGRRSPCRGLFRPARRRRRRTKGRIPRSRGRSRLPMPRIRRRSSRGRSMTRARRRGRSTPSSTTWTSTGWCLGSRTRCPGRRPACITRTIRSRDPRWISRSSRRRRSTTGSGGSLSSSVTTRIRRLHSIRCSWSKARRRRRRGRPSRARRPIWRCRFSRRTVARWDRRRATTTAGTDNPTSPARWPSTTRAAVCISVAKIMPGRPRLRRAGRGAARASSRRRSRSTSTRSAPAAVRTADAVSCCAGLRASCWRGYSARRAITRHSGPRPI